ncbi:MAG: hypothetical protein ACYC7L_18010 [Nitrospirota bacterium]
MTFPKEQQKFALAALIAVLIVLNGYRYVTREAPKTAPLAYPRGAVASSPVRQGFQSREGTADPISLYLERQRETYPGVSRDIFRMERPAARSVTRPVPTVTAAPSHPLPPERSPEEIAADRARADLAKFRYLGYLTEKDNTLFLSKDGELFIMKIGERVQNTYKVKDANKDAVVLLDTDTGVERRIELAGDGAPAAPTLQRPLQQALPQQQPSQPQMQQPPQLQQLKQQPKLTPMQQTLMQQPDPQQTQPQRKQPTEQQPKPWLQKRRLHNLKQLEKAGTVK